MSEFFSPESLHLGKRSISWIIYISMYLYRYLHHVWFLTKLQVNHRFENTFDADTKDLLRRLSQATSRSGIEGALADVPCPHKLQAAPLPKTALGTRIIIRPGEDGGVIALSEFLIAELASKQKFPTGRMGVNQQKALWRQRGSGDDRPGLWCRPPVASMFPASRCPRPLQTPCVQGSHTFDWEHHHQEGVY